MIIIKKEKVYKNFTDFIKNNLIYKSVIKKTNIKQIFLTILLLFFYILTSFAGDFDDDFETDIEDYTQESSLTIWDPLEKYNRKIFDFNIFLLKKGVKPIYDNVWLHITTPSMRTSYSNFTNNLKLPMSFINYALQLNFKSSIKSLYSFILNSTIGFLGFFNPAGYQEVLPNNTDFGITLAKYGVPAGPYLMLPFLGFSNFRDTTIMTLDLLFNPFEYNILDISGKHYLYHKPFRWGRTTITTASNLNGLIESYYSLLENSFDPYTLAKTAYEQMMFYKINYKE